MMDNETKICPTCGKPIVSKKTIEVEGNVYHMLCGMRKAKTLSLILGLLLLIPVCFAGDYDTFLSLFDNLLFYAIMLALTLASSYLAFRERRTFLWLFSGILYIALGYLFITHSLILMFCCLGIGFYHWARVFIS